MPTLFVLTCFSFVIPQCFQTGDLCGETCKCVGCENRAGSQKLIDKRRKMKDVKGTEFAVRVSQEVWQGRRTQAPTTQRVPLSSPRSVKGSSSSSRKIPPRAGPPSYMHPSYVGAGMAGQIGYSPMSVPQVTPVYNQSTHATRLASVESSRGKRTVSDISPSSKSPAVRLDFDLSGSRQKRAKGNSDEVLSSYFGPTLPDQPKTIALAVMSFLSNHDVYQAGLVCKEWNELATSDELWKFS